MLKQMMVEIPAPGYEEKAQLYTYFQNDSAELKNSKMRPVVVVCPGGGYAFTSDREAEPIALQYLAMGYHAVVLRYSVAPVEYPVALLQLANTVKYLKDHAEEFHIDPDKVIVTGFSAGGHLAANFGVFWNKPFIQEALGVPAGYLRPAGMILNYAVITSGEKAHEGSFRNLLGDRYDMMKDELSLEKQVTEDTPPTFLWHTTTDTCVPVENSLLFYQALLEKNIPAEMHIYRVGGHGLSLANDQTQSPDGGAIQPECESWVKLAEIWMKQFK